MERRGATSLVLNLGLWDTRKLMSSYPHFRAILRPQMLKLSIHSDEPPNWIVLGPMDVGRGNRRRATPFRLVPVMQILFSEGKTGEAYLVPRPPKLLKSIGFAFYGGRSSLFQKPTVSINVDHCIRTSRSPHKTAACQLPSPLNHEFHCCVENMGKNLLQCL